MPNQYEPFDPAHEFTWTAAPGSNTPATNGPATNGHAAAVVDASDRGDLEVATGSMLLFAQRVADDTIADARREAERILDEAPRGTAAHTERGSGSHGRRPGTRRDARHSEQLRVESRVRNLLMNDLVECVTELSNRVEREISEAMEMLEQARARAVADFSAIKVLARFAGLPTESRPESPRTELRTRRTAEEPEFTPAPDSFLIDLRDAVEEDRSSAPRDQFDELFAPRGVYSGIARGPPQSPAPQHRPVLDGARLPSRLVAPLPESTAPALLIVPALCGIAFVVLQVQSRRRKAARRRERSQTVSRTDH